MFAEAVTAVAAKPALDSNATWQVPHSILIPAFRVTLRAFLFWLFKGLVQAACSILSRLPFINLLFPKIAWILFVEASLRCFPQHGFFCGKGSKRRPEHEIRCFCALLQNGSMLVSSQFPALFHAKASFSSFAATETTEQSQNLECPERHHKKRQLIHYVCLHK